MARPGERGAALVLVLWVTAAVGLLAAALATNVRFEARRLGNEIDAAVARQAIDGALALAVLGLADPDPARRWVADGRAVAAAEPGVRLEIRSWDEMGRLDLNRTPEDRLRRILRAGLDLPTAAVEAILAGRRQRPLVSVAELAKSLDAVSFRRLVSLATLHNGLPQDGIAATSAAPALLHAWPGLGPQDERQVLDARRQPGTLLAEDTVARLRGAGIWVGPPGEVFTVRVLAVTASGARASVEALLWLRADRRSAYRVLEWREPAPDPDAEAVL